MKSSIYGQCSVPSRASSTRRRRSIDIDRDHNDDRELIKLTTTQTVLTPDQKSSFVANILTFAAFFILLC